MVWPEPAHDRYASTARLYPDRAETDAWRRPAVAAGAEPAAAAAGRAARAGAEPAAAAERQPARADRSDAARRRPLSSAQRAVCDHHRDGGAADRHGGDLRAGFRRRAGHLQGAEDGRRTPPQRADRVCPPEGWRDRLRGRVSQLARTVAPVGTMPAPADQLLQQALAAHRRGAIAEAAPLYRRVLEIAPTNNVACTNLAAIATQAGDLDEAETMFRRAVELKPDAAEAHYNLGFILQEQGKLDAAIEVYRRALALRPDMPQAYTNLGVALQHQGKLDEAVAAFRQTIACNPKHADAYFNLGAVLRLQNHVDEAAAAYRRVIELDPSHAAARNNLALILSEAGELSAADDLLRQAVRRWPDYAEGHNNLGAMLLDQGRPQEALDALQAALRLKPDYPEAYLNMGNALRELGSLGEAIAAYRRAVELRPTYAEALAQLVYHRARACDWTDAGAEETLLSAVRQNAARIPPFMLMATAASAADQLLCARKWVEHFVVPEREVFRHHAAPRAGRLRIGYLSSDFHDHATAYLIAELIERHDRDRFEIHGYSYGADQGGGM